MNCQECLEELATTSLRELPADSAIMRHCATCPDCAGLTTRLREREYEAASILNNLPPMSNPITVAEAAVELSRRRRIGRVVVTLSGIAGALIIGFVSSSTVIPAMFRAGVIGVSSTALRTETIPLSCLSPAQAADIINPYVRSRGSVYYTPSSGISAITVRGTADEVARSRNLIHDFENDPAAACRQTTTPTLTETQTAMERVLQSGAAPLGNANPEAKPKVAGADQAPARSTKK